MEESLDRFGDRPVKQLVLPASHDSAMYLTSFPQLLGRTQNLSIYAQLTDGIRYFDLRPRWKSSSHFVLSHGPIDGPDLSTVLNDVRRYMNQGHRELVILKFSHYDRFDSHQYSEMIRQVSQQLTPWLFTARPEAVRLADLSLRDYVQPHGSVLIVCDGDYPIANPLPGIWVYRDWDSADPAPGDLRVFDQYSNSTSYPAMKADQFAKFNRYDGRCRARPDLPCDLFLLSWTLTPTTNVPAFAAVINPHLATDLSELKIPNQFGCRINLLYTDCVETAHATDLATELNSR